MEPREGDQARVDATPMSAVDSISNTGTVPVREGFHFDVRALDRWLAGNVHGYAGPLTVEQFKGGQSNPTFKLVTPQRTYVLRRKPPGHVLKGAHAVDREARVQQALELVSFPVAHVYGVCTDNSVIGSWFYIMEMIEGRIFWDATLPTVLRAERAAYFDAMNATLAQLHCINHAAIGLADYGAPGNYMARQIARWSRQYLEDADAGRDPGMDRLVEWLPRHVPADGGISIVHGDFRCDNIVFHPTEPRVLAVLDWELSTIGDPLADFAYHAMMYRMPPHIVAGLGNAALAPLGIPSESEYLRAYCARTGRDGVPSWDFYVAFNFFRLAAIFHGIAGRVIRGTAASVHARERAAHFPVLVRLACRAMEACQ